MSIIPLDHEEQDIDTLSNVAQLQSQLHEVRQQVSQVQSQLQEVILGQSDLLTYLLCALIAEGHVLIEGTPGLGKTLAVKALGRVLQLELKRIQCTADLMPNDILGGTQILQENQQSKLHFVAGPIFTQLLFVDEINRANPRTQSALLEAMAERQVSLEGQTQALPSPFMLLATQNPLEQEGTYALPEAQADRFMFKVKLKQPTAQVLAQILTFDPQPALAKLPSLLQKQDILQWQRLRKHVIISSAIKHKLLQVIMSTRPNSELAHKLKLTAYLIEGASPRAAQDLYKAVQAHALLHGRLHAIDEDLSACLLPVLGHRVKLHWEAQMQGINSLQVIHQIQEALF